LAIFNGLSIGSPHKIEFSPLQRGSIVDKKAIHLAFDAPTGLPAFWRCGSLAKCHRCYLRRGKCGKRTSSSIDLAVHHLEKSHDYKGV
jgi:hypothetical protein